MRLPRKRIIMGEYVRPVPWLIPGDCNGCYFEQVGKQCPNGHDEEFNEGCDGGGKYDGKIFIDVTPEALAEYITRRLTRETANA